MHDRLTILCGDAVEQLRTLAEASVQTCVTSPPYWGLRDYGVSGQIGLERTPEEYVGRLVEVFREVRRVLKPDGTAWVNLGDCFTPVRRGENARPRRETLNGIQEAHPHADLPTRKATIQGVAKMGLKSKDLIGIPWRVAFALQADGWWLRCDIVWHKPNPMPESVTDRPTRAHEFVFLLSKAERYFYDAAAIREEPSPALIQQIEQGYNGHGTKDFLGNAVQDASGVKGRIIEGYRKRIDKQRGHSRKHAGFNDRWDKLTVKEQMACGSNKRSVWSVATMAYPEAHFATYPEELIKPCILAGSRAGDVVLDPFAGSGTTGKVALELGRKAVLIELNPEYVKLIERRCDVTPGLALA